MAAYKEIVTKAIIGKGKKMFKNSYSVEAEHEPTTVLGAWIINHNFKGYKDGFTIGVEGSFDVNIWYSYENDSKTTVTNQTIKYDDTLNVRTKADADLNADTDIIVRTLKQPTCFKVNIEGGKTISFDIEKELGVEIVGETKVKIAVEEDEEPWDELVDDIDEDDLKEIDEAIDENYISESTN